jgi:hypothetical protein
MGVGMNHQELAQWASKAMTMSAEAEGIKPKDWWPGKGLRGQGHATTFSWALVLHAVKERFGGQVLDLHAPWHGDKHLGARERLIEKYWKGENRKHWLYELNVDFAVVNYDDETSGQQIRLIAESEMYAGQDVSDDLYKNYVWDFVKLVVMAAPLRLFTCRVGAVIEKSGSERRDELERSLKLTVQRHSRGIHDGDELGVLILPEDWRKDEWRDLRVGVLVDGELVFERPWMK